jgi:hypothetical protein
MYDMFRRVTVSVLEAQIQNVEFVKTGFVVTRNSLLFGIQHATADCKPTTDFVSKVTHSMSIVLIFL